MAKRAAAGKGGVVISQEILAIVEANKAIKGPEVMTALREKYPRVSFNEASCQVAYANARKKLGLTRTVIKRPGDTTRPAYRAARPGSFSSVASSGVVNIDLLQAAKVLLQHCNGDAALAQEAVKQIAALQMG